MTIDYLLLGHLTRDLLPDGESMLGGTALYSALAAHRLGAQVGVVSAALSLPAYWPQAVAIAPVASTEPPTFENHYANGIRIQTLHAAAAEISLDDIPLAWRAAPIIHLGPILGEVPQRFIESFPGALICVTPQGWMRSWAKPLPTIIHYTPWKPTAQLLRRIDALVLSIEDVHGDEAQARSYAAHCRLVALTRGAKGATLFVDGVPTPIAAVPAAERDPTGAGDVFAAALFWALHNGVAPVEAAQAAAVVAAASVEMGGADGLLTMRLIQ